jgi:hypothetical protein
VLELPSSIARRQGSAVGVRESSLRRGYRVSRSTIFSINAPAAPLAEFANYLKIDCSAPDHARHPRPDRRLFQVAGRRHGRHRRDTH